MVFSCSQSNNSSYRKYSWNTGYISNHLFLYNDGRARLKTNSDTVIPEYESYFEGFFEESDTSMVVQITQKVEISTSSEWNGFLGERRNTNLNQDEYNFVSVPSMTFRKVTWGDRRYLVHESEILSFIAEVNSKIEPRSADYQRFYIDDSTRHKSAFGIPNLPYHLTNLIDTSLVIGKIDEINNDSTVWIKFPKKTRTFDGMMLFGNSLMFMIALEEAHSDRVKGILYDTRFDKKYTPLKDIFKYLDSSLEFYGVVEGAEVQNRRE